jgi:sensor histidine kinase YesM
MHATSSLPALPTPASSAAYAPPAVPVDRRLHRQSRTQVRSLLQQARWIVPACLLFALSSQPHPWVHPIGYLVSFAYTLAYFAGLWLANGFTTDVLNRYVGWEERPVRRLLLTLAVSLGASLFVIVSITEGFSTLLWHQPFGQAVRENLAGQLAFPLLVTVVISLFMHSRSFLLSWREATVRAERLEKESAVARLDSLRRQVDPHFLFNSLNALTSLVEEEPQRAVRFIRQLSSVYRYVLDSQSQELVPLTDELAFAEAYVFLQKTRLDEALQVEFSLPPAAALASLFLPPLALQLLLENALKHNTAFQADPLHLLVSVDVPAATLTVRNTLRPRRLAPNETSGRGLDNLRARYAFLTPRPVAAEPVGEEFVVTLPLLAL